MTKRHRRRRIWLVLLGIVALVVGVVLCSGVLYLRSDDFERRATLAVATLASTQTGEEVVVEDVRVRLWPPAVVLDQLAVRSGSTGESIATVERVRAPLVLRGGGVKLGRLTLDQPDVLLHLDEQGKLVEFRDAPRGGKPLTELPWSSLEIIEGRFRLVFPDGELSVTDLQSTPVLGTVTDVSAELAYHWRALEDTTHLELPGVVLGPDRIEIPDLDLDTRVLDVQGAAVVPLQGEVSADLTARAWLEELNVLMEAPRAVHGTADLDLHLGGTLEEPVAEVVLMGTHVGYDQVGVLTPLLTYEFGNVVAAAIATPDGVDIERLVMEWADGEIVAHGHLTPEGELVDVVVLAEDISMARALQHLDGAPTPWIDFRADLESRISGVLQPLHLQGPFELAVRELKVGNAPIADPGTYVVLDFPRATGRGHLDITTDQVIIDATEVLGPRNRGTALAVIAPKPRGPLDLQVDMVHANLNDFQPLSGADLHGVGRVKGRIWGPFNQLRLEGSGEVTEFSAVGIPYADHLVTRLVSPEMRTLELRDARATKGRSRYAGDLIMDFRDPFTMETDVVLHEGRVEDILGIFIDLPGLEGDVEGTLTLSGPVNDFDGECNLTARDVSLWGERFPEGRARGYLDQGLFTLDDLRLTRAGGEAGLVLRGSVLREWALNMELVGDGLRLERLDWLAPAKLPVTGRASIQARIDHTLFEPEPHGRVLITDVRYAGAPVDDSVATFRTTEGVMAYEGSLVGHTVSVEGTLGLWEEQPYALSAVFRQFPAHIPYPVAADGSPVEATVSGELDLSGHFGESPSPVDVTADLSEVLIRWSGHELRNTRTWHYEQDGRSVSLRDFSLAGGTTGFAFSMESGPRGVDATGHGQIDLDLLRVVVPSLSRSEGLAMVQLSAEGKAPDVEALLDVDIDATLLRHDSFPGAFEDLKGRVLATRDRYELTRVEAGLGGGTIVGGGSIDAERWVPERFNLHARADDAQIQWVDYLPPAIGNAQVTFQGPLADPLLSGEVVIDEAVYLDRIDWEDWVVEWRDELLVEYAPVEEEPLFSMDVHIAADRTFRIRNNVAEGTASGDLRVIGDTVRPGLVGEVVIHEDAVAFIQDREFQIERGVVAFRDPWTWDPDIDFDLVTDITSRSQRYRVTYMVRGPFSGWTTETRSDPPLPQSDVNALLWFGVTTDDLEEMGELEGALAQSVLDMMLTDIVLSRTGEVGDEVRDVVDRVDVITGVNSRGEYSSDPRVLIEKRIEELGDVEATVEWNTIRSDDVYVRGEWDVGEGADLGLWFATLPRDRPLPTSLGGGAAGVDLEWRVEFE